MQLAFISCKNDALKLLNLNSPVAAYMVYCKPVELTTTVQITLMLRKICAGVSEKSYLCGSTHHINVLAVTEPERTSLFRSMFPDISGTKSGRSVTTTSALYARKYKISLQAILLSLSTCCTSFHSL